MIRFSVWLVSCYAHIFVRLYSCNCHAPQEPQPAMQPPTTIHSITYYSHGWWTSRHHLYTYSTHRQTVWNGTAGDRKL